MRVLIHFVPVGVELPATDAYRPASLDAEGFVHLCRAEQVADVRRRHFAGQRVRALVLDAARLEAPVVEEDLYGHGAFPHLYGPIPADAVVAEVEVEPGDDDDWLTARLERAVIALA